MNLRIANKILTNNCPHRYNETKAKQQGAGERSSQAPGSVGEIQRLRKRLGVHRRRLRYWANLPSLTGFGPNCATMNAGLIDMKYEEAAEDAMAIAQALDRLGDRQQVIDIKGTFAAQWNSEGKQTGQEVLIWPPPEFWHPD